METISELFSRLTADLEDKVRPRITNHMPDVPMAVFYAGENTGEIREAVESTMQNVWRGRAAGVCQMYYQNGKLYSAGENEALDEGEIQERIDEMSAREDCFRTMENLMLCLVLNTENIGSIEAFEDSYTMLDRLQKTLGISCCNVMKLVLLDESGKGKPLAAQIRANLRQRWQEHDPAYTATVLLSNRLTNGVLLTKNRIRENYLLAGDLMILANGRDEADQPRYAKMFPLTDQHYLTAAYSREIKPNGKIAEIVLNTALEWIYSRLSTGSQLTVDQISQKLEISGGQLKVLEDAFRTTILSKVPAAEILEYLPRNAEQPEFIRNLPFSTFDHLTMGSFEPFYQMNVGRFCEAEEILNDFQTRFRDLVSARLTPREAARSLTPQTVQSVLQQIPCEEVSKNKPAAEYLQERAKADYCAQMLPVCADILEDSGRRAKDQIAGVSNLIQDFQQNHILNEEPSLQYYYQELTQNDLNDEIGSQLMQRINRTQIQISDILDVLYESITKIFAGNEIFGKPLDEEMIARIGGNTAEIQAIIQQSLTGDLSKRVRLQTAITPSLQFSVVLLDKNSGSEFYTYLMRSVTNAESLNTGNRNIVEFIQLYAVNENTL